MARKRSKHRKIPLRLLERRLKHLVGVIRHRGGKIAASLRAAHRRVKHKRSR